ncbi:MAG: septation ring formation regulator EzrA, partial [Kurthia sp.]
NRYRTSKQGMNEHLLEAENAFRDLRFNKALEIVATAVENAEPGALKKMQVLAKDAVTRT